MIFLKKPFFSFLLLASLEKKNVCTVFSVFIFFTYNQFKFEILFCIGNGSKLKSLWLSVSVTVVHSVVVRFSEVWSEWLLLIGSSQRPCLKNYTCIDIFATGHDIGIWMIPLYVAILRGTPLLYTSLKRYWFCTHHHHNHHPLYPSPTRNKKLFSNIFKIYEPDSTRERVQDVQYYGSPGDISGRPKWVETSNLIGTRSYYRLIVGW